MSLSNYPPGVSGNEPQIAGVDSDEVVDHREVACDNDECDQYEQHAEQQIVLYSEYYHQVKHEYWEWTCPKCGNRTTYEDEIAFEDMHDF